MEASRWDRLAPLSGVVFVVLTLAGLIVGMTGSPSDFPAQVPDIVEYYSDNTTEIFIGTWLGLVGALFLVWFGGALRARLRGDVAGADRLASTAFGGVVAAAAVGLAIDATNLAGALRADEDGTIDPAVATSLYDQQGALVGGALPIAIAIFIGATAVAVLRTGVLPRWLGYASAVLAVGLLIPWIAFFLTAAALLWVLVVSILLYRTHPDTARAAPPPERAA